MTGYAAILNSEVDPESPITTSLMVALRDNPIAITEGSSGAPNIVTAAITDANVTQAKLPTSTVSLFGSLTSNTVAYLTLHNYMFFPMIHAENAAGDAQSSVAVIGHVSDGADPDAARCGLANHDGSNTNTYDFDYRYISS